MRLIGYGSLHFDKRNFPSTDIHTKYIRPALKEIGHRKAFVIIRGLRYEGEHQTAGFSTSQFQARRPSLLYPLPQLTGQTQHDVCVEGWKQTNTISDGRKSLMRKEKLGVPQNSTVVV